MGEFSIKVPVKPYVKWYLEHKFGDEVRMDVRSAEWAFFKRIFQMKSRVRDYRVNIPGYEAEVEIVLTQEFASRYGIVLTKTGVMEFNNFIAKLARTELRVFVGNAIGLCGMRKVHACKLFASSNKINEDRWPLESMLMAYERRGKKNDVPSVRKGLRAA